MRIVIIEDEKGSAEMLKRTIQEIRPNDKVIAVLKSVKQSVSWLKNKSCDLIFLDIELSDGVSFKIFDSVKVSCPVIFTTAYDSYAIEAFKLNSVSYLLKPIKKEDLQKCFDKLSTIKQEYVKQEIRDYSRVGERMFPFEYKNRFLIKKGDKLVGIQVADINYFHAYDRFAFAVTKNGDEFLIEDTLEELELKLNPTQFFRLNRQVLAKFEAIKEVKNHFKTRYKVILQPSYNGGEIVISTNKSKVFLEWANR